MDLEKIKSSKIEELMNTLNTISQKIDFKIQSNYRDNFLVNRIIFMLIKYNLFRKKTSGNDEIVFINIF